MDHFIKIILIHHKKEEETVYKDLINQNKNEKDSE